MLRKKLLWLSRIIIIMIILLCGNMNVYASSQAETLVSIAKSQLGFKERKADSDDIVYNDWYYGRRVTNVTSGQYAWCASFVSWCANEAGLLDTVIPRENGCLRMKKKLVDMGGTVHKRGSSYLPQKGDIIFFGTDSNMSHVGIVDYSTGTNNSFTVYYIDGNNTQTTPHGVHYSSRTSSRTDVWGYVTPKYAGGNNPTGVLDIVEGGTNSFRVRGWAFDKDDTSKSLEMHVYIGGEAHPTVPCKAIIADELREDVNKAYQGVGNYHGFDEVIYTDRTGNVPIYVYAINVGDGTNVEIGHGTVTIAADTEKPTISNVRVTDVTNAYYVVSCDVSDNSGIESVRFPSWHCSVGGNKAKWYDGTVKNGVASATVYFSDLGGFSGTYFTHIYARDKAGNETSVEVRVDDIDATTIDQIAYADIGTNFVASILNQTTGTAVTVNGSNDVVSCAKTDSEAQKWLFTRNSDGTYTITSRLNGYCLDNEGGSGTPLSNVCAYQATGNNNQKWYIKPNKSGGYYLQPKCSSNSVLDLPGADSTEGVSMILYLFNAAKPQCFVIEKESALSEKSKADIGTNFYAYIQNTGAKKVLTVDGSNVISKTDTGAANQRWKFVRNSDGSYEITVKETGKYLQNESADNYANVRVSASTRKTWNLYAAGDGSYYLHPTDSVERVLDLTNYDVSEGTNIEIFNYNASAAQRFAIKKEAVKVSGISLDKTSVTLAETGAVQQLTANILPADADNKNIFWSSSNSSVARVNAAGLVSAVSNGTAVITATTEDGNKSASCTVTVAIPIPVTGISMTASNIVLESAGASQQIISMIMPGNATNQKVTWSSSDTSVATVSSSGVVTAVSNGTAVITVTTEDGKKTASCNVIVSIPVSVTGITLDRSSLNFTAAGVSQYLTANIVPANASNQLTGWSSSNTSVATVDENGMVTSVGNGTAVITAITEDGGKTASCTVTVAIPVKVSGISLDKSQINFTEIGSSQQLTATVSPSNATNKKVIWSSNDKSIASVSNNGLVTAAGEGTTVITAVTEDGSRVATCIVSVQIKSEHTHNYSKTVTKAPACKSAGTAVHTCIGCGDSYTETIPATGHIGERIVKFAKEPTCSVEGYTGDTYCVDCGELLLEGKKLETTEHSWGEGIVTSEATCKAEGIITFTCITCGEKENYSTGKAAHNAVKDNAVQADCKNDGKTEGSHCSVCQEVLKAQITIPKLDHQWDAGRVTKPAACTAEGEKTYYCSACGDSKTEKIEKTAHTVVKDAAVSAGCTTTGKTEGSHCNICGEIIIAQTDTAAAGHKWNSGTVTSAATCISEGEMAYNCSVCGEKKLEKIAKAAHAMITDTAVSAGCTTTGKTEGSHCGVCGIVGSAQNVTAAVGHQWDAGKITAAAGTFTSGTKTYTCVRCGAVNTEAIPPIGGPAVGTQFKDSKSSAYYQITKADANGTTVTYVKPTKKNKAKTVTIPNTVTWNGITYKVTEISKNAYKNDTKVSKLIVGNNVENIGASAFYGCKKLSKITMGNNVKVIGSQSFRNCVSITSITIPAVTESVGKQAFQGCKKLKKITIKSQKLNSKNVGSKAFSGVYSKAAVKVPKAKVKEYKKLLKSKGLSSKASVKK